MDLQLNEYNLMPFPFSKVGASLKVQIPVFKSRSLIESSHTLSQKFPQNLFGFLRACSIGV